MSLDRFQIFCPNKHSDVQLGQHTDRTFQVQIQVKMMRLTRKASEVIQENYFCRLIRILNLIPDHF